MAYEYRGDPVHMEISSANAGGTILNVAIYDAATNTARTLQADEFVSVTDLIYVTTAGGAFTILFGTTDGAGKRIAKGTLDAKSGLAHHFDTARTGPVGVLPGIIAAAGQIDLMLEGYISK
jgi:hypothetical protein